jgi:hypothetical protein
MLRLKKHEQNKSTKSNYQVLKSIPKFIENNAKKRCQNDAQK